MIAQGLEQSLRKASLKRHGQAAEDDRRKSLTELEQLLLSSRERNLTLGELCVASIVALPQHFRTFAQRGYIFEHASSFIYQWELLLVIATLYSTYYLPLRTVFPDATWPGALALETCIDASFLLDCLCIKPRTSFRDHGYDVMKWRPSASRPRARHTTTHAPPLLQLPMHCTSPCDA